MYSFMYVCAVSPDLELAKKKEIIAIILWPYNRNLTKCTQHGRSKKFTTYTSTEFI